MAKLIKTASVDAVNKKITLVFGEKVSLSNLEVADYDRLIRLQIRGVTYTIGPIVPDIPGDTVSKKWIVSYTGTSLKKKNGTVIDTDEVVVVIETKEVLPLALEIEDKKKAAKKQTKKKVTQSTPVKKKSKKK